MVKKIISNELLNQKIEKIENFLKKRADNKKNLIQFPNKNETTTTDTNIVLAEAFDQLKEVVIGGIDKEGRWWFSMSLKDDSKALWIIENFKLAILESALDMEDNEGRDI